MTRRIFFFLGTTAELIKVMPVMREFARRGQPYEIIASGQNDISSSELFAEAGLPPVRAAINKPIRRKTAVGLIGWFVVTFVKALFALPAIFRGIDKRGAVLIVHGDTVSTVMGAVLGKIFGLRVAHIEAGLRSFNFLQPFPEELDRYVTSHFADFHFCPYRSAVENLRHRSGTKVDTGFNTNIDSLAFARGAGKTELAVAGLRPPFFIFILHRQENLLNKTLIMQLTDVVLALSDRIQCVLVTHEPTLEKFRELGVYDQLCRAPGIKLIERQPYLQFIPLLDAAEFIMTDGGGNQQECSYLGKPCLILRNVTESEEGMGRNVVLGTSREVIEDFVSNYERFRYPEVHPECRPSDIIVSTLFQSASPN